MRTTANAAVATGPPPARRAGRFDWERALDDATLPQRTIAVAFALATFANADGTSVRPGIPALARRAHLPESTTRAHLKVLREAGWARRISLGSRGGTHFSADEHHLTVPASIPASSTPVPPAAAPVEDDHRSPEPEQRSSTSNNQRSQPSTTAHHSAVPTSTTAHQQAQVDVDHRSPVSEPPPASERTTAHQSAPTNHHQISTKGARAGGPPPRCPRHSRLEAGAWGPPCHDCAVLRRAHAACQSDRARILARVRRACTECDELGWLLGPDHTPLCDPAVRCSHPTVPDEVWSGEAVTAPPKPPLVEAPATVGRHRLRDDVLPEQRPPGWRPSPRPRAPATARAG